jgi:hypothetical protein
LAHRHLTLTYGIVGILLLVLVLMGIGGYLGLKSFNTQLAAQATKDAQYQADRKTFMDTLTAHDAERVAQATQIAQLEAQIAHRAAQPLPKPVQEGLKPNATAQMVAGAVQSVYSSTPIFGAVVVDSAGYIALSPSQGQQVAQTKVDLDKAQGDLGDQKSINSILNVSNSSLTSDLGSCKALNVQANKDIEGYKKLAVKSKWRKFLDGALKVVLVAGGAAIGHAI